MTEDAGIIGEIEVRTLDLQGKGFYPKYRRVIAFKQSFMDPERATLEDLDEAFEFLCEYIVKPESRLEKEALLNQADPEDFVNLFVAIAGGSQAVPPQKSAESDDS